MLAPGRLSADRPRSWQPAAIADRLSRFTMVVAAALTFVLAIVLLADVVSRVAAGRPMSGARDIIGNVVVMVVFLQAGYAVRCRSMQRTEFLLGLMPWPVRRVALAAGYAIGAVLFAAIAAANWYPALMAFGGSAGVAAWIARFVIVFGAALACANYGLLAILDLTGAEPSLDSEMADLRRLEP